jgi:hypothetical protein
VYECKAADGRALDDSDFSSDINILMRDILGEGPSLKNIFVDHCDPSIAGRDKTNWKPSLGKKGWVSISKYEPRRFESSYYICVYNSNDTLSSELLEIADAMSLQTDVRSIENKDVPTSLESFANRKEYNFAKVLARRNNDKIAMALAEGLGLKLNRAREDIDGMIDLKSRKYENIAIPDTATYFGHIAKVQYSENNRSKDSIAIYDNCGSIMSSAHKTAVPLNPIDGVALFEGLPTSSVIRSEGPIHCVPCGVGHDNTHRKLDSAQMKYIDACVHWDGKSDKKLHSKTTRQYRSLEAFLDSLPLEHASYKNLEHVFTTLPAE